MRSRAGLVATALVAFCGALAGTAVANHQFSDVSTSNVFHDSIDNLVNAGCATGFPNGTFKPTDPVNRQQLARIINACGGRLADGNSAGSTTQTTTPTSLVTATMDAGAVGPGGGLIFAIATVEIVSASTSGFPCEVLATLTSSDAPGEVENMALDLPADTSDPFEHESATLTATFVPVAAGTEFTATLNTHVRTVPACTAAVSATGSLSLMYFPFTGDGSGGGEVVN